MFKTKSNKKRKKKTCNAIAIYLHENCTSQWQNIKTVFLCNSQDNTILAKTIHVDCWWMYGLLMSHLHSISRKLFFLCFHIRGETVATMHTGGVQVGSLLVKSKFKTIFVTFCSRCYLCLAPFDLQDKKREMKILFHTFLLYIFHFRFCCGFF